MIRSQVTDTLECTCVDSVQLCMAWWFPSNNYITTGQWHTHTQYRYMIQKLASGNMVVSYTIKFMCLFYTVYSALVKHYTVYSPPVKHYTVYSPPVKHYTVYSPPVKGSQTTQSCFELWNLVIRVTYQFT